MGVATFMQKKESVLATLGKAHLQITPLEDPELKDFLPERRDSQFNLKSILNADVRTTNFKSNDHCHDCI